MAGKKSIIVSKSPTLGALFQSHGYETIVVSDGLSALPILASVSTDLLVIDADVPNGRILLGTVMGFAKVPEKITIRDDNKDTPIPTGNNIIIRVDIATSDETWLEIIENSLTPTENSVKMLNTKDKVLIVDDVVELLEMYKTMFEMKGYRVDTAKDGLEGITKAVSFKPKYILLDIMMPHMDGFELMKTFYNNTSLDSVLIVNSNIDGAGVIERIYSSGADYYIRKSDFVPSQIVIMIEKGLFDKKRDKSIKPDNKPFDPGKDFFESNT